MGVGTHAGSGPGDQCFKVDLGQTFGWRCPDNLVANEPLGNAVLGTMDESCVGGRFFWKVDRTQ